MKLYYMPGTCSLPPHIVLRGLNLEFELVRVNNRNKITADGRGFFTANSRGYVVAFKLDDEQIPTEGPAMVQYLADRKPEYDPAPHAGSRERVCLQEWLNFITNEIHAGSAPLFSSVLAEDVKTIFRDRLLRRFDFPQMTLNEETYLTGPSFSVADAYLFTVLGRCKFFAIPLDRWLALSSYTEVINARLVVQAALRAEAFQQGRQKAT